MTNPCDDLIPALVRAADGSLGELPARERARLDEHLRTCAACADALAGQRAMREALAALASAPITTHVGGRVMAGLREEARTAGGSDWLDAFDWRRWTWRLVPVAAALALTVASVAGTSAAGSETTAPTEARPVSSALVTGEVAGTDLLSLLLSAGADETLTTGTTGGGQ